jgi:hypothetical protein
MSLAFVLGNGVSRNCVDLPLLQTLGTVYGCNGIYRDFVPNVLVSTDLPISTAIQNSGYSQTNTHYTRKPLPESGAKRIPQTFFGFSSGPAAVGIATQDRNRAIYLVGFDMGPIKNGMFNNVYANTEFYKKSSSPPTYTGNWVRQLLEIMKNNPKISFFRIVGDTTADIAELRGAKNLAHMTMADFLNRINNTKEL